MKVYTCRHLFVYLLYTRRRRRDMLLARQRFHHLQQYHMKGNPIGNGSAGGVVDQHRTAYRSTVPLSLQSTLTRTSDIDDPNQPDIVTSGNEDREWKMEHHQSSVSSNHQQQQLCSHINGDVFYVSGRANTAPCTTANDLADQTATTFKYFTYDRDYFRERQKSSCLRDQNLRHSMQ